MRLSHIRRGRRRPVTWDVARRGVHAFIYQPTFRDGRARTVDRYPRLRESGADWSCADDGYGDLLGVLETQAMLEYMHLAGIAVGPSSAYPKDNNPDGPYAVSDHFEIDQRSGNEALMQTVTEEFGDAGIFVWGDAPICHVHTSHDLFQRALADPLGEAGRMFTFLRPEERELYDSLTPVFPDFQPQPYVHLDEIGLDYVVRFYGQQAALRGENPRVHDFQWSVIRHMVRNWGQHGVRLDAWMYAVSKPRTRGEHDPEALKALARFRARYDREFPGRALAVEVAGPRPVLASYLQDGMAHLGWDFEFAAEAFYALVTRSSARLRQLLTNSPAISDDAAYGIYLRQWDELQLLYADKAVRETLLAVAGEAGRFVFNAGLTPRLAELVPDEDARQMLFALLMTVPGVPWIYAGDLWGERGLRGRPERLDSRTATSWGRGTNAEFSEASGIHAELSPDWRRHNVRSQWGRPGSFLERSRARILMRNALRPLQDGDWLEIQAVEPQVLAFARRHADGGDSRPCDAIVLHNLQGHPSSAYVTLGPWETMRLLEAQIEDPQFTGGGRPDDWQEIPWVNRHQTRIDLGPYETKVLHPFKDDPTIF